VQSKRKKKIESSKKQGTVVYKAQENNYCDSTNYLARKIKRPTLQALSLFDTKKKVSTNSRNNHSRER
jgi:hypothetical protein